MGDIKSLRLSKGITRIEFAKAVGVSPRHIDFIERGHRNPSITVALKIAGELGVSVNDVFSLEREVPSCQKK